MAIMTPSQVSILPVKPEDFTTLARLEHKTFAQDNWTAVAFGPDRNSEEAVKWMAAALARPPPSGVSVKILKAVIADEIVGFASWSFHPLLLNGMTSVEDEDKDKDKVDEKKDHQTSKPELSSFPPGCNMEFCYDAYVVGDKHMFKSVEGQSFAKLTVLSILPAYQRQGIGSKFMRLFTQEVDEAGFPAILAGSPEGRGLYKKFGFKEVIVLKFDLQKYGGTKDMGIEDHIIMKRPAKTK